VDGVTAVIDILRERCEGQTGGEERKEHDAKALTA
jgi:hypothetical protein